MKNFARQIKTEKRNLSLIENEKGNRQYKGKESMKRHFIAIMERIAKEKQGENGISIY
ncbi:MAG: hypothetical protein JJE25_03470 [Bacteroidia bacterium]|nr:hypothetical protein [Bacteroidia bacterium]